MCSHLIELNCNVKSSISFFCFVSLSEAESFYFHVGCSANKVGELIEDMVGYNLTTPQTLPSGVLVKKVGKHSPEFHPRSEKATQNS